MKTNKRKYCTNILVKEFDIYSSTNGNHWNSVFSVYKKEHAEDIINFLKKIPHSESITYSGNIVEMQFKMSESYSYINDRYAATTGEHENAFELKRKLEERIGIKLDVIRIERERILDHVERKSGRTLVGYWSDMNNEYYGKPKQKSTKYKNLQRFKRHLKFYISTSDVRNDAYKGSSVCRICKKRNGSNEMRIHNEKFAAKLVIIPSGYLHYLEVHNVRPHIWFEEALKNYYKQYKNKEN